ncbi:peptidylprolyl isomerase [Desulfobacter latus]|uniref:Peptidyl-prolyl cis-trans isomerase n=1 Tax=Desulfobacter latus TaxID=2292 RepID=A0A850ST05_9BACT|nr:peptidyl-prolyl cis-trans isomerase [Desulfobacter latus]NWH04279.1 peptidyl-prolyl cis-trans isomerase [Desulfobacter latus]
MKRLPYIPPARTIRIICIFISILFLTSSAICLPVFGKPTTPAAEASAEDNVIIAMANHTPIPKAEFIRVLEQFKKKSPKKLVSDEEKERLIHNLIIRYLILEDPSINEMRQNKAFIKRIKAYENEMLIKQFLNREIGTKLTVTDEEVLAFYKAHSAHFAYPDRIDARVILLRNQEEAEQVMEKIKNGKDFINLIKEYSIDLPSAANDGKIEIEKGKFFPEIEKEVFSLKENEISRIIKTQYGHNIFKIEKIKPAEPKPFVMVKDEIKKQILKQKESQAFLEMAAKLEKEADIKISKKVLDSIE